MTLANLVILVVRYGIVVLFFPASALDKMLDFKTAVGQAQEVFSSTALARTLIVVGIVVELLMPLGIVSGIADRLAAFILAGYCALTAVLFKRFWKPGDFWIHGKSQGRTLFWDFLKNLSLASGLLLITVGLDGRTAQTFVAHPLSSSQPYASR